MVENVLMNLSPDDEKNIEGLVINNLSRRLSDMDENKPRETKIEQLQWYQGVVKKDKKRIQETHAEMQRTIDNLPKREVFPTPDFLIDASQSEKRVEIMKELKKFRERRYFLFAIADILQSNDYEHFRELMEKRDRIFEILEEYNGESKTIKLFVNFKDKVGEDYSQLYARQEVVMDAVLCTIMDGEYIDSKDTQKTVGELENIISQGIDTEEFNTACEIETAFLLYEIDRMERVLAGIEERVELVELVENLNAIRALVEPRQHAAEVMGRLIEGSGHKDITIKETYTDRENDSDSDIDFDNR